MKDPIYTEDFETKKKAFESHIRAIESRPGGMSLEDIRGIREPLKNKSLPDGTPVSQSQKSYFIAASKAVFERAAKTRLAEMEKRKSFTSGVAVKDEMRTIRALFKASGKWIPGKKPADRPWFMEPESPQEKEKTKTSYNIQKKMDTVEEKAMKRIAAPAKPANRRIQIATPVCAHAA